MTLRQLPQGKTAAMILDERRGPSNAAADISRGGIMRRCSIWLAAILALGLAFPHALHAQNAAALSGQVTSAEEGAMEGVLVSAKKTGSTITITVVSDAQGHYSFPASKLEPAAMHSRSAPSAMSSTARRRPRSPPARPRRRHQAAQDEATRLATHQCRMARQHARQRSAEAGPAQLRELPFARAHRALDARRRGIRAAHAAHERLRQPEHAGAPATPRRAARARGARRPIAEVAAEGGRIPQLDQSERKRNLGISAQDPAASDRPRHPGHHHRV